jgi:hypothetical protein
MGFLNARLQLWDHLVNRIENSDIGIQNGIVVEQFNRKSKQTDMGAFGFVSNCVELYVSFGAHYDDLAFPKEHEVSRYGFFMDAERLRELFGRQFASEHQIKHSQSNWVCEGQ